MSYAYAIENDTVRITGARYSGTAAILIRESQGAKYASLSAYEISLMHAFFDAAGESDADYARFVACLSDSDRALARDLGYIV